MSVASTTDIQIFKRLANTDVVDVELAPASGAREAQRKATEEMRAAIDKANCGDNSRGFTSVLGSAMAAVKKREEEDKKPAAPSPSTTPVPSSTYMR